MMSMIRLEAFAYLPILRLQPYKNGYLIFLFFITAFQEQGANKL